MHARRRRPQPAFVGREPAVHLEGPVLAPPLEQASRVYASSDVVGGRRSAGRPAR